MTTIAEHIILKIGGFQKTAEMLGLDVSRIYRWTYPKCRGGTGGVIPTKHQNILLTKARLKGIDLMPEDFFKFPIKDTSKHRSN